MITSPVNTGTPTFIKITCNYSGYFEKPGISGFFASLLKDEGLKYPWLPLGVGRNKGISHLT